MTTPILELFFPTYWTKDECFSWSNIHAPLPILRWNKMEFNVQSVEDDILTWTITFS